MLYCGCAIPAFDRWMQRRICRDVANLSSSKTPKEIGCVLVMLSPVWQGEEVQKGTIDFQANFGFLYVFEYP